MLLLLHGTYRYRRAPSCCCWWADPPTQSNLVRVQEQMYALPVPDTAVGTPLVYCCNHPAFPGTAMYEYCCRCCRYCCCRPVRTFTCRVCHNRTLGKRCCCWDSRSSCSISYQVQQYTPYMFHGSSPYSSSSRTQQDRVGLVNRIGGFCWCFCWRHQRMKYSVYSSTYIRRYR